MRRVAAVSAAVLWLLLWMGGTASAADLTGGCTLEARSFLADGTTVLDTGTAPGTKGSQTDPFKVAWDGRVDFRFTTGATVFSNNTWQIFAEGLPILSGKDDNPIDRDESGNVQVGKYLPVRITGLVNVSGWLQGNGGTARCDGNGWVQIVGDPAGTIPWFVFLTLLALGALFLIATPYTGDWEEGGYSPMPGGPVPR